MWAAGGRSWAGGGRCSLLGPRLRGGASVGLVRGCLRVVLRIVGRKLVREWVMLCEDGSELLFWTGRMMRKGGRGGLERPLKDCKHVIGVQLADALRVRTHPHPHQAGLWWCVSVGPFVAVHRVMCFYRDRFYYLGVSYEDP